MSSNRVAGASAGAIWITALSQLKLVVPEATYNLLFADSIGRSADDGGLTVVVPSDQAKAWIEARMGPQVETALQAAGHTGTVSFQAAPSSAGQEVQSVSRSHLPTPGPVELQPGDIAFTFLNFDLYARGWLRTPSYYELFWQPVLGYVAYAYWRLAQVLYWNKANEEHTRRVRLDIQDSAAHMGVSRDLIRGKPPQGLGGALKTLQDHGLAQVEKHATGRATVYSARFRRHLPLLTAQQIRTLTQSQQREHLDWLLEANYDPSTWEALSASRESFVVAEDEPDMEVYARPAWRSEQLSRLGYLRTPVYYDLFLQPLIGPVAYAIWRVLRSMDRTNSKQTYSKDTLTSVYALAATLNCNRQRITGVRRRRNGGAYWQEGAFDRLQRDRLALIREEGKGSNAAYRMLVVNEPPLLCPSQVERFSVKLRQAHSEWIRRAQLQLAEWSQLSMESLLSLLD